MRMSILLVVVLLNCAAPARAQSEATDPYSLRVVQSAFSTASVAPGGRVSFIEKRLARLGDAAAIALLKLLDETELKKPRNIEAALDVIRQAFSNPQAISTEVDKQPKVTLCFLDSLMHGTADAQLKTKIEETIKFVKTESRNR